MSRAARVFEGVSAAALLTLLAVPAELWAQAAEPLSAQRLGRPYVFMFVAYAVVLSLIAVFVFSIAVRLARVEKRLQAD